MKICIVIWRMAFSGAENVANALINEFINKGHEVQIILTSNNGKLPENIKAYDVSFDCNAILRVIKRSLKIREIVKREKFDVVVGFGHIDSIHIIRALPFVKTVKIACERMDPATYPFTQKLRRERDFLYKRLGGIIVQTTGQKEYYDSYLNVPTVAIPNPVRETGIKAVPIQERKNEFVTVARLDDQQKNHTFMFQCFKKFCENHNDYVLKIYGSGPDESKYKKLIEEMGMKGKILLCGKVDNPQECIKTSKAFLLTSRHEGMPNALIEAMSIGLPCIATDCGGGGVRDLIINGVNGIIVKNDDLNSFVEAMNTVAESKEIQNKLSTNALEINETLELSKIADKWIAAFETFQRR